MKQNRSLIDPDGRFAPIIEPVLGDFDYRLVRVTLMPSNKGRPQTLQVMVEPNNGGHAAVDVCANISRALSALFDVEDPVRGKYVLEVSSPGMARPLTRFEDFEAHVNFEVKMELYSPNAEGRKRFRGVLSGVDVNQHTITLTTEDGPHDVPFGDIAMTKIQVTDDMIREALNKDTSTKEAV